MRLIDADELRDYAFEVYQGNGVELETIMVVPLAEINNAPTVDLITAMSKPQGEWSITDETDEFYGRVYKCTHCGKEVLACGCRNFCTWCGVSMVRGKDQ